jgi:hypothetical protein
MAVERVPLAVTEVPNEVRIILDQTWIVCLLII